MRTILQIHTAQELIGKTIIWNAPASKYNATYGGVAKIVSVDPDNRRPIKTETISGDYLDYAFVDEYEKEDVEMGLLCYSDGGRHVTFEVKCTSIEDVIEKHWNHEAFVYYYEESKRESFDKQLTDLLIEEGIENPFHSLMELRSFALDHRSKICGNA